MYSPPERGIDPPSTPQTIGMPIPAMMMERTTAMIMFPPE